jgi:uncharacterized damage-inducible protein DinB
MEVKEELIQLFEYDLWANLKWFPLCPEPPYRPIMEHVIRAQVIWLERCGGQRTFGADNPYDLLESVHLAWVAHVDESDLEETISYRNSMGISYQETRLEICRHTINHGTYHRGQLRMLAEISGLTNWPETDYILYLRDPRGS